MVKQENFVVLFILGDHEVVLRDAEGTATLHANLLSMSLIKQRSSLVLAWSRVLSKFLTKLLHLSIQELLLSITHLAFTGIKNTVKDFSFTPFWWASLLFLW